MAELAGAFRTLDASLAIYPLLQWLHARTKRTHRGQRDQSPSAADERWSKHLVLTTSTSSMQVALDEKLVKDRRKAEDAAQAACKKLGVAPDPAAVVAGKAAPVPLPLASSRP